MFLSDHWTFFRGHLPWKTHVLQKFDQPLCDFFLWLACLTSIKLDRSIVMKKLASLTLLYPLLVIIPSIQFRLKVSTRPPPYLVVFALGCVVLQQSQTYLSRVNVSNLTIASQSVSGRKYLLVMKVLHEANLHVILMVSNVYMFQRIYMFNFWK